MDEFLQDARVNYGYNSEQVLAYFLKKCVNWLLFLSCQALGMLFWHKCDIRKAKADLVNFVPYPGLVDLN